MDNLFKVATMSSCVEPFPYAKSSGEEQAAKNLIPGQMYARRLLWEIAVTSTVKLSFDATPLGVFAFFIYLTLQKPTNGAAGIH